MARLEFCHSRSFEFSLHTNISVSLQLLLLLEVWCNKLLRLRKSVCTRFKGLKLEDNLSDLSSLPDILNCLLGLLKRENLINQIIERRLASRQSSTEVFRVILGTSIDAPVLHLSMYPISFQVP